MEIPWERTEFYTAHIKVVVFGGVELSAVVVQTRRQGASCEEHDGDDGELTGECGEGGRYIPVMLHFQKICQNAYLYIRLHPFFRMYGHDSSFCKIINCFPK